MILHRTLVHIHHSLPTQIDPPTPTTMSTTTTRPRRKRRTKRTIARGGVTGVEDVDTIILSYVHPNVIGTLMLKYPNHPLLTANSRLWYNRIVMTLGGETLTPPYQLDWEGLLPTDYRSLWYALTSPAYLNYTKLPLAMTNVPWAPSSVRYTDAAPPGKNTLEAALDMTAIRTNDPTDPYRWSEAIIALLAEHVIQFIHGCEELEDSIVVSGGGRLPSRIMTSIAPRGCTQLISRLVERSIVPEGELAVVAMTVGQWCIYALGYTPELYILASEVHTIRFPTLAAHTISALWNAYVGADSSEVRDAIQAANLQHVLFSGEDVNRLLSNACRDKDLLTAILGMLDALRLTRVVSIVPILTDMLMSRYREVDDYSTVRILIDWYTMDQVGFPSIAVMKNYIANELAPEILYYYATRIKTKEQSHRFMTDSGLIGTDLHHVIKICHGIFNGSRNSLMNYITRANATKYDHHIQRAILYLRIYIAGALATDDVMRSVAILRDPAVRDLMKLTTLDRIRYNFIASVHPLSILVTAARNMDVLEAAYSLFTFGQRRVDAPDLYGDILADLKHIGNILVEIARDPDNNEEAIPWLIERTSSIIPHTMAEWKSQVTPNSSAYAHLRDVPFPRQELWVDFIFPAIQVPIGLQIPYGDHLHPHYSRLRSLIGFSTVPKDVNPTLSSSQSRTMTLPSMDLRSEADGGLPTPTVLDMASAMGRSHIRSVSVSLTYESAYMWELESRRALIDVAWRLSRVRIAERSEAEN